MFVIPMVVILIGPNVMDLSGLLTHYTSQEELVKVRECVFVFLEPKGQKGYRALQICGIMSATSESIRTSRPASQHKH